MTILPNIILPKEDELLSSWIFRLSKANYNKVHTFCRFHFKGIEIWNRDIDKLAPNILITRLSHLTNISIDIIKATTLKKYEGNLFESCNSYGNQKWILPLGIFHRTRLKNGLQFCPKCLAEDGMEPYYRKSWRLSLSVCCTKCLTLLHDHCPFCMKPIIFFRNELGYKLSISSLPLTTCHSCKSDLRNSPRYPPLIGTIAFQWRINKYLSQGWTNQLQYSIQYFEVLYQCLKLITTKKERLEEFQKLVLCGRKAPEFDKDKHERICFDKLSTITREHFIGSAVWLLDQWPSRFVSICKETNLYSSSILQDSANIPFWFSKIINQELYLGNPFLYK